MSEGLEAAGKLWKRVEGELEKEDFSKLILRKARGFSHGPSVATLCQDDSQWIYICWCVRRVSLPWQDPVHELDYARQKFLATAIDDTEKDELTDLLGEVRSVPLMAYTAAVWKDEQSKIDTQKRVNMKLRDEFVTEMTPLLGDPSWSNPQHLQYIRDLAIGQATSDPADFFDETVYDCFFKPYL